MTTKTIVIAQDFSAYPGGRYRNDGQFSGEAFREDLLIPALRSADHVVIDIDGTEGFGSSFLDEVFGGLIRQGEFTTERLRKCLSIVSVDRAFEKEIWEFMSSKHPPG